MNLVVTPKPEPNITTQSICPGDVFNWDGVDQSVSGLYTITTDGCSANEVLDLTVVEKPQTVITNETICSGENFEWNGQFYSASTTETQLNDGCTADESLVLTVTPSGQEVIVNETICSGETFAWNGSVYSTEGQFVSLGTGCDGDETLNLVVTPKPTLIITNETICEGETFVWNGQNYSASTSESQLNDGCTADEELALVVTPKPQDIITTQSVCDGDVYTWNGIAYDATGEYVATNDGCTSNEVLMLTVIPRGTDQMTTASICAGEAYTFLDQEYALTGIYEVEGIGTCSGNQILNLTVFETTPDELVSETICRGEFYTYEGVTYMDSGEYTLDMVDENGCNYNVILNISIEECVAACSTIEHAIKEIEFCPTMTFNIIDTAPETNGSFEVITNEVTEIGLAPCAGGILYNGTDITTAIKVTGSVTEFGTYAWICFDNDGCATDIYPLEVQSGDCEEKVGLSLEKTASSSCACPGSIVDYNLTVRMVGGLPGMEIRNVEIEETQMSSILETTSTSFDNSSDAGNDAVMSYIDTDGDGISEEEFVFNYSQGLNTTTTGDITGTAILYYKDQQVSVIKKESFLIVEAKDECCISGLCNILVSSDEIVNENCQGNDGLINITVEGGIAPFEYLWSNGSDNEDLSNLPAGTYEVTITDSEECAVSSIFTVGLTPCILGQLGDVIWADSNADGIQNDNEEGIENAEVRLLDSNGVLLASQQTDSNGNYRFIDLFEGNYSIEIILPTTRIGYIKTFDGRGSLDTDSDVKSTNGNAHMSNPIYLGEGEVNLDVDGGFYLGNKIGNQVWFEGSSPSSGANVFDLTDEILESIEVTLMKMGTEEVVMKEYTDVFGRYLFTDIESGDYYLEFKAPSGFSFIRPNMEGDDTKDSDVIENPNNPGIGRSHEIKVHIGDVDLTIDAGLLPSSIVVAIELLSLSAEREATSEVTNLLWKTVSEINSDYFIVERSNTLDGEYKEIGNVKAAGNSSSTKSYSYADTDAVETGSYYYRLRMVDFDGSESMSNIVSVEVLNSNLDNQQVSIKLYPNPVMEVVNIDIETEYKSSIEGGLFNAIGQQIQKIDISSIPAGTTKIKLDVSGLSSGTYFVRAKIGNKVVFKKLTKTE